MPAIAAMTREIKPAPTWEALLALVVGAGDVPALEAALGAAVVEPEDALPVADDPLVPVEDGAVAVEEDAPEDAPVGAPKIVPSVGTGPIGADADAPTPTRAPTA